MCAELAAGHLRYLECCSKPCAYQERKSNVQTCRLYWQDLSLRRCTVKGMWIDA